MTVDEYLATLKEPRRSEVEAVHAMIRRAVPKLEVSVQSDGIGYGSYHYKYASGREGDWPIIGLSSRAQYISVYVCASEGGEYVADRRKGELPKANVGKSCIRFRRLADVDLKVLESIVKEGARVMGRQAKALGARSGG